MQKACNLVRGFERLQHYTVTFLRSVVRMEQLRAHSFQRRQLDVPSDDQMGNLVVLLVPIALIRTCHGHETEQSVQLHGEVNEDDQNEETDVNLARFVLGGNVAVTHRSHRHKGRIQGREVVKLHFAVQIFKHHEETGREVDQIEDGCQDFKALFRYLVLFGIHDQIQQANRLFNSQ